MPAVNIQQQVLNRILIEEEITACENEAIRLAALLQENRQACIALNEKLNSTALINAVIPQDVMLEIFSVLRQDEVQQDSFASLPTPFLLGHVCKAWRTFTRNTPHLWSTIAIRPSRNKFRVQFSMIQESLTRAKGRKLDIYIREGNMDPTEDVLQPFLQRCAQWRTFESPAFESLSKALSSRPYYFPSLQSLVLKRSHSAITFDFTRTTQLNSVVFQTYDKISHEVPLVAWQQLRILTLQVRMGGELLDILRRLVNIEILTLKLEENIEDEEELDQLAASSQPNSLGRNWLTYLSKLTVVDGHYTAILISVLETPVLKRLEVESTREDGDWLLRTRPCGVEELIIHNLNLVSVERLLHSFQHFLFLTTLVMMGSHSFTLCDQLIKHLNPGTAVDFDEILPNLTRFDYSGHISFTLDAITSMLEKRLSSSQHSSFERGSLKTLKVFNIKYYNEDWIQRITVANPNALALFYAEVSRLSTLGTTLNLVCASQRAMYKSVSVGGIEDRVPIQSSQSTTHPTRRLIFGDMSRD